MDFPRLVFKSPGPFDCNGGTYGHVPVENESEYEAAIAAGYHPTVPEALAANKSKAEKKPGQEIKRDRARMAKARAIAKKQISELSKVAKA